MKLNKRTFYPSKLLLFGEYSVTKGSDALAIPFELFKGSWRFDKNKNNKNLISFAQYLKGIKWEEYGVSFYYKNFIEDVEHGLYFDSTIKTGYGIGSSGALSAAVFDSYFTSDNNTRLKIVLSQIENYFHGASSGIDPLVSYLNKTVKLCGKSYIKIIDSEKHLFEKYDFYLLDSGISRSTKHFVEIFNNKFSSDSFNNRYFEPLFELNNRIISNFIKNKEEEVFCLFKKISNIQYHAFEEMIVPKLKESWKKSLSQGDISIKLCGAGGGGYYLIMKEKQNKQIEIFDNINLIKIRV